MKIDLNKLKKLHESVTEKGKGGNNEDWKDLYVMLSDGDTFIRLLPAKEGEDPMSFYASTYIHRLVYKENGKEQSVNYHCLRQHGKACPICEIYSSLWDVINAKEDHDGTYKKLAGQLKGRQRFYLNAIQRDDSSDTSAKKPKIFSIGEKLFSMITGGMTTDFPDLLDLNEGNDLRVNKRVEKGSNGQSYPVYDGSVIRPKPTPVFPVKQDIAAAMDSLHDLKALVKVEDYQAGKELLEKVVPGISEVFGLSSQNQEAAVEHVKTANGKNYLEDMQS